MLTATNTGTPTTQHQVGGKALGKELLQCVLSRHQFSAVDIPTPSHGRAAQQCKRPEEEEEEGKSKGTALQETSRGGAQGACDAVSEH